MTQPPEPPPSGDERGGQPGQPQEGPSGQGHPPRHDHPYPQGYGQGYGQYGPYGQYGQGYGQPYGPGYSGQVPGYGYGTPGSPTTNGKATASLVVGVGSLVLSWCCGLGLVGIVAIVLGVRARAEIRASGGTQDGDGMALGGIVTGAIGVVLGLLVLVLIAVAIAAGGSYDATTTYGTEL